MAASRERIDIVIALDRPSIANNEARLSEGGLILYDSSLIKEKHGGSRFLDVPLVDLATSGGGNRIMVNTVATGAALGLLKMGLEAFFQVIGELPG